MSRRFDAIKVGDQLTMKRSVQPRWFWVVTDIWFDPVKGQRRRSSGEMVGIQMIAPDGRLHGSKSAHTIRGLAQAGYRYADIDYRAMATLRSEAVKDGKCVGIGAATRIRKRWAAAPWNKPL
jgi:hypothetical protein